jgi:hypothetical protein
MHIYNEASRVEKELKDIMEAAEGTVTNKKLKKKCINRFEKKYPGKTFVVHHLKNKQ